MNIRKRNTLATLLAFCCIAAPLYSLNKLTIKQKNGTITEISTTDINKLTFAQGALQVDQANASDQSFLLSSILGVTFFTPTGLNSPSSDNAALTIYPNPANNFINIEYTLTKNEEVLFKLLDLQGKVVMVKELSNKIGRNREMLTIKQVNNGIYLATIQIGAQLICTKIIKN